mmetsp:Transcript_17786/g.53300  ORF Transcript_17786/g.53300 Transcript_17786/m.53300 type:complete len:134 (-) Transcript_17786:400-801(-)|eukprot:351943-Chlamydomonas_euryale.AAC.2
MSWGPPPPQPGSAAPRRNPAAGRDSASSGDLGTTSRRPASARHAAAAPTTPSRRYSTPELTLKQVEHLRGQLRRARERGLQPQLCRRCNCTTVYCYLEYYKRGGTKYLYACETCLQHTSRLEVSEEDYDFLAN